MSTLDGALRQLRHNDGNDGNEDFVFAYDREITDREFARVECELAQAEEERDDLQRQLAAVTAERDQYKAACEMAGALRPLGAVQVVEGGGAVLLDTSKGAT